MLRPRPTDWLTCFFFPCPLLQFFMTLRCCLCRFNVNFRHFILRKIDKDRTTTAAAAAAVEHFHLPLLLLLLLQLQLLLLLLRLLLLLLFDGQLGYLTRLWGHFSGPTTIERNSKTIGATRRYLKILTTFNCCGILSNICGNQHAQLGKFSLYQLFNCCNCAFITHTQTHTRLINLSSAAKYYWPNVFSCFLF